MIKKTHLQLTNMSEICLVIQNILDIEIPNLILKEQNMFDLDEIRHIVKTEFAKHNISTIKDFVIDGFLVDDVCHISQGSQVVHGNCKGRVQPGLLRVDLVGFKNGLFGDAARTYFIPQNNFDIQPTIINETIESFNNMMEFVKTGHCFYEISKCLHESLTKYNLFIVEQLTGHGIGEKLHEYPSVLNFFNNKFKEDNYFKFELEQNMVFAVEPVVFSRKSKIQILDVEKSEYIHVPIYAVQKDINICHYENTIFFTDIGPKLLSKYL